MTLGEPTWIVGIGAMKAGSTTLHADLSAAFEGFALQKESDFLFSSHRARSRVTDTIPQDARVVVDVSATYAMSPERRCPAETLAEVSDGNCCVVYIVRNPIDRILSHLRHDLARGIVEGNPDQIVLSDTRFIQYSLYSMQLAEWQNHFGNERIVVLRFEEYVSDRLGAVRSIAEVSRATLRPGFDASSLDQDGQNRGSERPVATGLVRRLIETPAYKSLSKSQFTQPLRSGAKKLLLSRPSVTDVSISAQTEVELRRRLEIAGDELACSYLP